MAESEISIKVNVPEELKPEFERVLSKIVKQFERRLRFTLADELLKNSKITEELALKWGSELKERAAKKGWS